MSNLPNAVEIPWPDWLFVAGILGLGLISWMVLAFVVWRETTRSAARARLLYPPQLRSLPQGPSPVAEARVSCVERQTASGLEVRYQYLGPLRQHRPEAEADLEAWKIGTGRMEATKVSDRELLALVKGREDARERLRAFATEILNDKDSSEDDLALTALHHGLLSEEPRYEDQPCWYCRKRASTGDSDGGCEGGRHLFATTLLVAVYSTGEA